MKFPVIITNFKTYESATGEKALGLAKIHDDVAQGDACVAAGASLICALGAVDIFRVSRTVSIPVFAQHVDFCAPGKNTGFLTIEAAQSAGARGSLLNHAEHQISLEQIVKTLQRAQELSFEIVVCAADADTVARVVKACRTAGVLSTALALEPPALIGGDISVISASPDIIKDAVLAADGIPLLVGAGVKTGKDVAAALVLGARGVLLASGVAAASDPQHALFDLVSGLQ